MSETSKSEGPTKSISRRKPAPRGGTPDLSSYVFGRVQPQAVDLEEAVLGAIMLDKDALPIVLDILRPESFYTEAHQAIYSVMKSLFSKSEPIDLLTVTEALKKAGDLEKVGGAYKLVELTNRIASAANIEFHARIVAQKFIQRQLIHASTTIIKDAFEDTTDVFELLDSAERQLFEITEINLSKGVERMSALSTRLIKQLEELSQKEDGLTGIPSGFADLDTLTSGWQPSDLIIIAARPGMGKTSFVLSMARNASMEFGKGIALFSLEMSNIQLVQRLLSMESGISSHKLRTGKLSESDWKNLHKAVDRMSEAPIFIDDTPGINIFELRAKSRRLKMQHDIQLIVIDYLQLMTGGTDRGKGNREQEVSAISRSLKALAKELNVPVIALSQLSRAVELRGGQKKPQLSDLRESGSIEQDADIVSFIYRPEYYQITQDDDGNSLKEIAEIIIAKHRNGATDTVNLRFIEEFAKFSDLGDPNFNSLPNFNDPNQGVITRSSRLNSDDIIPF